MTLDVATLGINVDARQIAAGDQALNRFEETGRRAESTTNRLTASQRMLAGALALVAVAMKAIDFAEKVIEQQRAFDKLNTALVTATKSAENADVAFSALRKFAASTPYDLQQTTKAFIQLVNFGLDPSERALRSYGNTAAGMGKDLSQLVEAVADAATGEFERLKEFGIKSKTEGDKVSFTFRGTTKTVANSAEEIQKYLIQLGETDFAGGMERQSKTLDGTLSNLADTWDMLLLTIAQSGFGGAVQDQAIGLTLALEDLDAIIKKMTKSMEDNGKETKSVSILHKALTTVFETIAVLAVNIRYIFKQVGTEIGVLAAQGVQAAIGIKNLFSTTESAKAAFANVAKIGEMARADAAAARAAVDAESEAILGAAENARAAREKEAADKEAEGRDDLKRFQIKAEATKGMSATQKKAYDDAMKKSVEYVKSLEFETSTLGATEQQQFMLAAARKAAEAPTEAMRLKIMQLALGYTLEKEKTDEAAEAKKAYEAAAAKHIETMVAELVTGAANVERMKEEVETYGMGTEAIGRYNLAKLQKRLSDAEGREGNELEIAQIKALIGQQEKLNELMGKRAAMEELFAVAPVQNFGDALRDAFGSAGDGMAKLGNLLKDYQAKQKAADQARAAAKLKYIGDDKKVAKEVAKINATEEKDRIEMYANMAGAAKGFFGKQTAAYAVLEAVERGFRAFQIASELQVMATKMFATETVTAAKVGAATMEVAAVGATVGPVLAAEGTKQTAYGISALASALSAPWPANIPAFIAVAAMLASIGIAIGGGGGGASKSLSASRQESQGTGTVLGDSSAKSESVSKSLELLTKNSNIALGQSQGMLASLRSIDNGISAMASRLVATSGITGSGIGGSGSSGFWSSIFGGKTSVEDTGFYTSKSSLGEVRQGNQLQASQYTDLVKSGGWFSSDKSSRTTSNLGVETDNQVTAIVRQMATAIHMAADTLGVANDDFIGKLNSFQVDLQVSLKDLKGDEIEAALGAMFSKLGDEIAMFALSGFVPFQKAGEGYLETVIRIAAATEEAQYELDRYGITSIKLADLTQKQGDVAAELVRESILAHQSVGGVADIMRTMNGTATELAATYGQLLDVQQQLAGVGLDPDILTRSLIGGAQGLDSLSDALGSYFENFFSEDEQLAAKTASMSAAFAQLGQVMPDSKEGFRDLIESIPKSTVEGQKLTGQLLLLAEQFADLHDDTESAEKAAADLARAAILAEKPTAGVAAIMKDLDENAEDLWETYRQLLDVQKQLALIKFDPGMLGQTMIDAAGGLDNLSESLGSYFDNFYSKEERLAAKTIAVTAEFDKLGLAMPDSKKGFRDLLESIPKTTEEGKKLIAQLLGLSEQFAALHEDAETAKDDAAEKAKEEARAAILAQKPLAGVAAIMKDLDKSADDLWKTYGQLLDIQQQLAAVKLDPSVLGPDFAGAAGDLNLLGTALSSYFTNFFTAREQLTTKTAQLEKKFTDLGQTMPATNEGFRALIESIPQTTAAGQKLIAQLLMLAPEFAAVEKSADDLAKAEKALSDASDKAAKDAADAAAKDAADAATAALERANKQRDLEIELLRLSGREQAAITREREKEMEAIDGTMIPLQRAKYVLLDLQTALDSAFAAVGTAINADKDALGKAHEARQKEMDAEKDAREEMHKIRQQQFDDEKEAAEAAHKIRQEEAQAQIDVATASVDAVRAMSDSLHSTLDSLQTDVSQRFSRQAAQAALQTALALARVTGKAPTADSLQQALSAVSQDSTGEFSNRVDYLRDYYRTALTLVDLSEMTDTQLSVEEKTLAALETAAELADKNFEAQMAALEERKEQDQANFDKEMAALEAQKEAEQANYDREIAVLDGMLAQAQKTYDKLNGIDTSVLSVRDALNYFAAAALRSSEVTAALIAGQYQVQYGSQSLTQASQVPGFASGGRHTGGWRMVGENGPELAYTGPESIVSNSDSADLLNNEDTVDAIDGVVKALVPWLYQIAKNTGSTKKTLDRWTNVGMPQTATTSG